MKKMYLCCSVLLIFMTVLSQNPIIKDIGMSDPHVRVFNDTVFLFCGHDSDPDDKTWVMKEWRIFSTTDLVNWTLRETISPKDNYMDDNSTDCWASDAATRNGKYYFYFSDRKRGIGVMEAEQPSGPYADMLDGPLVSPMHDPTILTDDDDKKTPYIVYGDKAGSYHIAQLNDDMISLAETPKPITIEGEEWENAPSWMDKNYIFKHKNTYYLSWGRDYAVSDNIYGPYQCAGAVGNGHNLNEYAHGSFFWWKGQFYHVWCYYIRPGYKFRESIISYCHFDEDDHIVTDTKFLDEHFGHGVGRYETSWPKIEAEWFYEKTPDIRKQENILGGFELSNITNGSWVRFSNVDFNNDPSGFTARIGATDEGGILEIRLDRPDGIKIGELIISDINESAYTTLSCNIKETLGKRDVYLIFTANGQTVVNLDWFQFTTSSQTHVNHHKEAWKLWQAYPNPASNHVFIDVAHNENPSPCVLFYDTCGRIVLKRVLKNSNNLVDVSELDPVIYQLKLNVLKNQTAQTVYLY